MRHRHLTREQYELALEEDTSTAARYRQRARTCLACSAALTPAPEPSLLMAWVLPASIDRPVDWEAALRRAISPAARQPRRGWFRARRLVAVAMMVAALSLLTALPAAASTQPDFDAR